MTQASVKPGTELPWDHIGGAVFGIEPECCGCPQTLFDDDGHGNPVPVGEECCGSPVATQVGPIAECGAQDARYIVAACNAYPELIEALELAQSILTSMVRHGHAFVVDENSGTEQGFYLGPGVLPKIADALAKARGQS